jgi:hypothetical protein
MASKNGTMTKSFFHCERILMAISSASQSAILVRESVTL